MLRQSKSYHGFSKWYGRVRRHVSQILMTRIEIYIAEEIEEDNAKPQYFYAVIMPDFIKQSLKRNLLDSCSVLKGICLCLTDTCSLAYSIKEI